MDWSARPRRVVVLRLVEGRECDRGVSRLGGGSAGGSPSEASSVQQWHGAIVRQYAGSDWLVLWDENIPDRPVVRFIGETSSL